MSLQVALSMIAGERDPNKLTNAIFFARHPERNGARIRPDETSLAAEWRQIRDRIVLPALAALDGASRGGTPTPSTTGSTPTAPSGVPSRAVLQWLPLAKRAGQKHGVDPAFILGVIAAESGGDPQKQAKSGYKGLMQAGKTPDHLTPDVSVDAGTAKLRTFVTPLKRHFAERGRSFDALPESERLRMLALAFNAGPATIVKALSYAEAAGDISRWFDAEHYKRALLFTGAYSLSQDAARCLGSMSSERRAAAKAEATRVQKSWAAKYQSKPWRTLPNPPPWSEVSRTLDRFVACAIDGKHRRSAPYAARILAYRNVTSQL
jgi:hypothetical protein